VVNAHTLELLQVGNVDAVQLQTMEIWEVIKPGGAGVKRS
jgi:hypothetical protein